MGNTIGQLASNAGLREAVGSNPAVLTDVVRETLRFNPPVHTTRRFVATPTRLGTATLVPGAKVLIVVAAANRDPAFWTNPERFDHERTTGPVPLAFGIGPHQCPGQRLAWEIALAGVRAGLDAGLADERFWRPGPRILPSANARIPEILDRHASFPPAGTSPTEEAHTP